MSKLSAYCIILSHQDFAADEFSSAALCREQGPFFLLGAKAFAWAIGEREDEVIQTLEDLIDSYYEAKNMVVLHQVNFEDLSLDSQKAIEVSKTKGLDDLVDFKGWKYKNAQKL